ncbi:MAG: hypothetical protein V7K35_18005 [Nostoc sp.]|uniref:hypothetical protein n=1 Tax=Nostoc sp. TaxID=1180 RepID=UPI002FFB082B
MTNDISHKRNLHRFDFVAYLVIEKFRLSPLTFGLLAAVTATVVYLFTAWISDTLWSKQGQMGLLKDWIPW